MPVRMAVTRRVERTCAASTSSVSPRWPLAEPAGPAPATQARRADGDHRTPAHRGGCVCQGRHTGLCVVLLPGYAVVLVRTEARAAVGDMRAARAAG